MAEFVSRSRKRPRRFRDASDAFRVPFAYRGLANVITMPLRRGCNFRNASRIEESLEPRASSNPIECLQVRTARLEKQQREEEGQQSRTKRQM